MPDVKSSAPDFTLYDTDKTQRTLSAYRGKSVVLAFYPAAFTGTCTKEMCSFRDALVEFDALDAVVLGISVDPVFSNKAYKEKLELNFPLLSDFNRDVIKKYDVEFPNHGGIEGYVAAKRSVFIIDPKGNLAYRWIAEHPGVEPDYSEIKEALSKINAPS